MFGVVAGLNVLGEHLALLVLDVKRLAVDSEATFRDNAWIALVSGRGDCCQKLRPFERGRVNRRGLGRCRGSRSRMTISPHNHQMWAVIGIYTDREDNIFWRRLPGGKVEAAGARALCEKDAEPLGHNIIHSVTNPIPRLTGAIHVYGGDFFAAERSEWDPETLREQRYDVEKTLRLFEEANRQ
jgi:hypothetical protein